MIIFMEGLPRSGKSYETCAYFIMEALKKGRNVDAYVEGLNHKKYSELTGIPLPIMKKMLRQIDVKQVPTIYNHVRKDSLVVIDELQDFWPTSRQQLHKEITTFVTQHGHDGHDIICMGQDLSDCHKIWKNRVDRKYTFQKQDVVGRPTKYYWTAYKAVRSGNRLTFNKIRGGTRDYEEKYFGLYKSHTDGTSNFDTFEEDRTNLFKGKAFTIVLPAFFALFFYACYFLYDMYGKLTEDADQLGEVATELSEEPEKQLSPYKPPKNDQFNDLKKHFDSLPPSSDATQTVHPDQEPEEDSSDYVKNLAEKYRFRLGGVAQHKDRTFIQIDVFDDMMYRKETFTNVELEALGWELQVEIFGVLLSKDNHSYVVRSWPIDVHGRVNATTAQAL